MSNASVYKSLFGLHPKKGYDEHLGRLYEWMVLPVRVDDRVLDVGCGDGKYTVILEGQSDYVTGIDMQGTAKHLIKDFKYVNIEEGIPFKKDFFDLVFCSGVAHHTKDPYFVFKEIVRVTKKGGKIYVAVYRDNFYYKVVKALRPVSKIIPFRMAKKLSFDVDNFYAEHVHTYNKELLDKYWKELGLKVLFYREGKYMHRYTMRKK